MKNNKPLIKLLFSQILIILICSQCNYSQKKQSNLSPKNFAPKKDNTEAIIEKKIPTRILSQWRGPNRDGNYPDKNLLKRWPLNGPKLSWQYDSLGVGYASAAVTTDKVYTVATLKDTSYIISFNHQGNVLWKKKMGLEFMDNYPGSRATPTICNDYGYYFSGLGVLYCFDAEKGTIIWRKDIKKEYNGRYHNSGYSENLIVHGDLVFCTPTGKEVSVVALNRFTGELQWKSKGEGEKNAYANPILIDRNGKNIFVIQMLKSIIGIDISNGERLWKFPMESNLHSNTPVYKDGYILAIDGWEGRTVKLRLSEDGTSVRKIWKTDFLAAEQGDVVILGDRIFGADVANYSFSCVNWNTGKQLYKIIRKSKPERIATISADSLLYCYSGDGYFYLVKPLDKKFETRGKFKVLGDKKYHYSHPVIHGGCLYVRHNNNLFVYDISER